MGYFYYLVAKFGSRLYYDEKGQWNIQIEAQKAHIHNLEQTLISTKKAYKEAMNNLSQISEEVLKEA